MANINKIQLPDGNIYDVAKKELTQAEYNALSTAEQNNGTAYFITDGDAGVATVTYSYSTTVTTDANGFFSLGDFDRRIIVLACWATQRDVLIIPFPRAGANADGQTYWWFKVLNENMAVRANFTLNFYMTYK